MSRWLSTQNWRVLASPATCDRRESFSSVRARPLTEKSNSARVSPLTEPIIPVTETDNSTPGNMFTKFNTDSAPISLSEFVSICSQRARVHVRYVRFGEACIVRGRLESVEHVSISPVEYPITQSYLIQQFDTLLTYPGMAQNDRVRIRKAYTLSSFVCGLIA